MKTAGLRLRGLIAAVCLTAAWGAEADSCDREAKWTPSETTRYFVVLAASQGVFHDRSGPSFVMLMKTNAAADESEMGAVGVYSDEKSRAVFGAVPSRTYEKPSDVMLRLEISEPQYERVLDILRTWDRRARENQLLYADDVFMNNILLVKQATEELNRCRKAIDLYQLDWGLHDRISDENARSRVPFLVFQELKRRNRSLHVE